MFLSQKILATVDSPINGKIEVFRSLAFGTYISVGGLTQSGGIVYEIWKRTLKRIRRQNLFNKNSLILGLGGGSVATLVKKNWPNSKIVGVEIDPCMYKLGEKFLNLKDVDINEIDAIAFCKKSLKEKSKFDLIIIDLYLGDKFPEKFDSMKFISLVKKLLSPGGIVIFNRLYYGEKRKESLNFARKVQKIFRNVEYFYPEANLMLICRE